MPIRPGAAQPDEIGPWSAEKLDLLAQYLQAYSTIMNKYRHFFSQYHYVDAFAGAVQALPKSRNKPNREAPLFDTNEDTSPEVDPEIMQSISGSPIRALETQPPFDACWFIDAARWRVDQLEELSTRFPNRNIHILRGDCNSILRDEVIPAISNGGRQKAVVFLDPYGLQVEWETVRELANSGRFDIFMNFSLMGVTRLLRREEKPDRETVQQLSRIMGDHQWIDELYDQRSDLFGVTSATRPKLHPAQLAQLYANRIRGIFKHVSKPTIMTNSRNSPLYALFVASHKEVAVKITNSIFDNRGRPHSKRATSHKQTPLL